MVPSDCFGEEIMIKNKTLLVLASAFILAFNSNNIAKATEEIKPQSRYPDYSYEFVGRDKCEGFNRKIFIFNTKLNKWVVKPLNIVWASVMPKYGMDKIQNAYTNLEFPIRFVSCLLQKDFKTSRKEALRFITNTTLGVGGLYDPAKDKFHIEPRQEDMGQALAHFKKIKSGPYLVLPIIPTGCVRDHVGKLLDCPLNPTSYVIGPVALVAKSVAVINKTTCLQPLFKTIDYTYADPYEITKKLTGVDRYIKNNNLDRREVLQERDISQDLVKISNMPATLVSNPELKADMELKEYNPQTPTIDCMRTALWHDHSVNDSKWSELSVWNKCFCKKINTGSVNIDPKHPNYKYRYILQENKKAPLAIIYPSIGEGIMSYHSAVLAKMFYDKGYSVVIQGSSFQWEFVKSMPDNYKPGFPGIDAQYLKLVTSKIINNLETKKACKFDKKVLIGTSFGAMTTMFIAASEEKENTLGITKYISICPPVEILFALSQIDKYSQEWNTNPGDIKMRIAITAEKVLQVSQECTRKEFKSLPFSEAESKLILGFIMKQKLTDLLFTLEKGSTSKKSDIYQKINDLSFDDYAKKYLLVQEYKTPELLSYDTSMYSMADFLKRNDNYKIYHALDDYYVNSEQLVWLKKQTDNKSVFFNNGSHLGFLYRKEFLDELRKDIAQDAPAPKT